LTILFSPAIALGAAWEATTCSPLQRKQTCRQNHHRGRFATTSQTNYAPFLDFPQLSFARAIADI